MNKHRPFRRRMASQAQIYRKAERIEAVLKSKIPADLGDNLDTAIAAMVDAQLDQHALATGMRAPDFELSNTRGRLVKLSHLLQVSPVIVSFFHGSWCPFCHCYLSGYQRILPTLNTLGVRLLAISPEKSANSASLVRSHRLSFDLLNDHGNRVAGSYGLKFELSPLLKQVHQQVNKPLPDYNGEHSWTLPLAATFLISNSGTICWHQVGTDFRFRATPEQLVQAAASHRQ